MSESTSETTLPKPSETLLNVPNQLTIARILLSIVMFVLLSFGWYKTSFALFVVTAGTDWLDGYWARKYGQVTRLGRVLDPFADKLFICGTFILLGAVAPLSDGTMTSGITASGITAWMAVLITGRELLVTTLRTFVEQTGGDFSAKWIGKIKMALQCLAAGWSMIHLSYLDPTQAAWSQTPPAWMSLGLVVVVWAAMLLTIYSGMVYVFAALSILRKSD